MSKLVPMTKDGETIDVNPLRVEDHKGLGWKVVGEEAEEAPSAEPQAKEKPGRGSRSRKNKTAEPPAK